MKWFSVALVILMAVGAAFAIATPPAPIAGYTTAPVSYTALMPDTYRVATAPGDVACGAVSSQDWSYQNAKLIKISSCSAIFGGPGDVMSGDYYFDTIYFDPIGLTNGGSTSLNGTYYQSASQNQWSPRIFYKVPGRDCYNWDFIGLSTKVGIQAVANPLPAPNSAGISFPPQMGASGLPYGDYIVLNEFIGGTQGMASTYVAYNASNPSYPTLRFKDSDMQTSVVYYFSAMSPALTSYEPVFITERGTQWLSVNTTSVNAQFATQLAMPKFDFRVGNGLPVSFYTLITDSLDRTLQNRAYNGLADTYPATLADPDTASATSPLRGAATAGSVSPSTAANLYMLGGSSVPAFAPYTITDTQSSGFSYSGVQSFWAGTYQSAVAYDSSSAVRNVDVNKYSAIAYSLKFTGNDYGIPVCTGGLVTQGDWTSCMNATNGSYAFTSEHRVQVSFLNANWIISEMLSPASQLSSGTSAINGGEIKLAKETLYGILNVNQTLNSSPLAVRLSDVSQYNCSYPVFGNAAIYDVLNSGNAVVGQIQVCPGTTYTFVQSGTSNSVKIHTYRTHYGSTLAQKWAETGLYSDEITLKDGYRYNLVMSQDPDKYYKVSLLWKNRDYGTAGTNANPDSLREIVIYNTDGVSNDKTLAGQSVTLLNSTPAYKLTFAGIIPTTSCRLSLTDANSALVVGNNTTALVAINLTVVYNNTSRTNITNMSLPIALPAEKLDIADISGLAVPIKLPIAKWNNTNSTNGTNHTNLSLPIALPVARWNNTTAAIPSELPSVPKNIPSRATKTTLPVTATAPDIRVVVLPAKPDDNGNAEPSTPSSSGGKSSPALPSDAAKIADSMADTSGNMYAKIMNILGVYVASAK